MTVVVAGVGMIPFTTPRQSENYDVMAEKAVLAALADSGVDYADVAQAFVGYVYGDSACGQRSLYRIGTSGIPVFNVNNNCSTGSSALFLARQTIELGGADVVLALGFEQMQRGALSAIWTDRPSALDEFEHVLDNAHGRTEAPMAAQFFGAAGQEYADTHGLAPDTYAHIAVKARKHAANNPYAVFRDQLTVEEVLAAPRISGPLTRLQCCPPTCGAAAAVLVSSEYARRHNLDTKVVIKAQAMTTDSASTFTGSSMASLVGYDMSRTAAQMVYDDSGVDPVEIPVVELHDCFTTNELLSYEALGLTPEGTAEKFIADGDNTYGGRVVTNPSGGLLSKGHPLGATGLAQCAELVWQLRGQADGRQVDGARLALQHNIGLGGAAVVTLYERVG